MADIFTPEKRSWVMSRIRGSNTKIDLRMEEMLAGIGYKFEKYPKMYGSPDFVIPRTRIAIFCDGDFWHGYRYHEKKRLPKKYWRDKIERNMRRDMTVSCRLRREGWSVLRFWEHDIERNPDKCIRRIVRKVRERSQRHLR
ncbi:MAG: DNA mismatch endonuclease Vsr [Nitrosopumilaceae archaeon]|nr:very short patch repair endonuclease [Nitrosopumilaceae archaeon]NIU01499.1 very short patch repair endonuclease [Nitrosopumilaceae archaeon]NIU87929.1 DNA mismatch endonuclease Vsr [Nitrosopumilaceae archaeon]NIV66210.1 DNA mismatch endonuclease Vsr [Nitrosopumilaceae archaeon]NIX62101.1 DNA mismatch endonuclease Vsr [Nitrosopumilaceae archaeon]